MKKYLCLILAVLMAAVVLPAGAKTLTMPENLITIGTDAFKGCDPNKLIFDCSPSSYAAAYAKENGIALFTQYRALTVAQMYTGTDRQLNGPANDAAAMQQALAQFPGTPYTVTRKTDLTANGILSAITTTFADAGDHDVSLFYYFGHGFGPGGQRYSGALVGTDGQPVTAAMLRARLDTIPGKKIVIIDACYSGHMIGKSSVSGASFVSPSDETAAATDFVIGFTDSFISAFSVTSRSSTDLADTNYYVITAANGNQTSLEISFRNGTKIDSVGLFTLFFTEGLGWDEISSTAYSTADADANGDGRISLHEGFTYAGSGAKQFAIDNFGSSNPQLAQVYPTNCTDFYLAIK